MTQPIVRRQPQSAINPRAPSISNQESVSDLHTFGVEGLQETNTAPGGTVLFSVNPPSTLDSDYCSNDQESILRNWHTDVLVNDKATTEKAAIKQQKSTQPAPTFADDRQANIDNTSKKEMSGKKTPGSSRRASTGEPNRKSELYKTELCISVHSGDPCKYGDNCQFAHSVKELNQVHRHPRYKTQLCKSFQNQGFCKYNDRCTFIHHPEEARMPPAASTIRESSSAQSPWSSSNSSPVSCSRAATPVLHPEMRNEYLRAASDPCITYQGSHTSLERANVSGGHSPVAVCPCSASDADQSGDGIILPSPLSSPQLEMRRTLSGPFESAYTSSGGIPQYHHSSPSLSSAIQRPIPGAVPFLRLGFGQGLTPVPTDKLRGMFPLNNVSPWQATHEADDDVQWASKLAHYISTPQNDFSI
ncbi:hypothetical protein BG011_009155 [Mortierella polycephala]|uniref:C3H1-type domain-containing protein n=1 Tax=Mortierella polycephala TaxID=41804 RepID=A0A9P6UAY7_9FUNG|nr:hypothetical protein BG011_009155 [Mortierella polycephala]